MTPHYDHCDAMTRMAHCVANAEAANKRDMLTSGACRRALDGFTASFAFKTLPF